MLLDRVIGDSLPSLGSAADIVALEAITYLERIAAASTFAAIKLGAVHNTDASGIQFLPNASPEDAPIVITHGQFVDRVTQAASGHPAAAPPNSAMKSRPSWVCPGVGIKIHCNKFGSGCMPCSAAKMAAHARFGSWLCENSQIEIPDRKFVSTSSIRKTYSPAKTSGRTQIEKTILRVPRGERFYTA